MVQSKTLVLEAPPQLGLLQRRGVQDSAHHKGSACHFLRVFVTSGARHQCAALDPLRVCEIGAIPGRPVGAEHELSHSFNKRELGACCMQ